MGLCHTVFEIKGDFGLKTAILLFPALEYSTPLLTKYPLEFCGVFRSYSHLCSVSGLGECIRFPSASVPVISLFQVIYVVVWQIDGSCGNELP